MNRKEMSAIVAKRTGLYQKDVGQVVGAVIEVIQSQLTNGLAVKLQGLGTFDVQVRAERTARDLQSGETIKVPSRRAPDFKPSKLLRQMVESSGDS